MLAHYRLETIIGEGGIGVVWNHPNTAAVYGFHATGGLHYLAMELVDGEDLASCLSRNPQHRFHRPADVRWELDQAGSDQRRCHSQLVR